MTTRTFTPDQLDAIGVPFELDTEPEDGFATELHREQVDTRRWVSVHALIFRAPDDGKTWRVQYEQGLTEHQDGLDPWGHASTVTATEVAQRAVTVQHWQDATEPVAALPAPALSDAERQFLTFALDQAAEEMSLGAGFTDADEAALASLRKLAGGEQQ